MTLMCEDYKEIKTILSILLNYDMAELIIKELIISRKSCKL